MVSSAVVAFQPSTGSGGLGCAGFFLEGYLPLVSYHVILYRTWIYRVIAWVWSENMCLDSANQPMVDPHSLWNHVGHMIEYFFSSSNFSTTTTTTAITTSTSTSSSTTPTTPLLRIFCIPARNAHFRAPVSEGLEFIVGIPRAGKTWELQAGRWWCRMGSRGYQPLSKADPNQHHHISGAIWFKWEGGFNEQIECSPCIARIFWNKRASMYP